MTDEIHIDAYDSNWPIKFEHEKLAIEQTLGSWIQGGVHHVGSTSVEGLSAKPIIDIMVGVDNLEEAKACIPLLEKLNYCYFPYKPEFMHWFCKPSPEHREFHLYLIEPTSHEWQVRLAFRDYLSRHSDTRDEYVQLKDKLAIEFKNDREAYTLAKADFIQAVIQRALN